MSSWAEKIRERRTANDWVKHIEIGDVLRTRTGKLRVVRSVSHHAERGDGLQDTAVIFVIQRCSWTHRCYTVYFGGELVTLGYRPTGAKVRKFKTLLDLNVNRTIAAGSNEIKCCDVKGMR